MRTKKNLVRLWRRPTKDGTSYTYYLRYTDLDGKFHTPSLGHSDLKKAEKITAEYPEENKPMAYKCLGT